MRVNFLFHHGHHVECIAHCVETKDARENLETSPRQINTVEKISKLEEKSVNNTFFKEKVSCLSFTYSSGKQYDVTLLVPR